MKKRILRREIDKSPLKLKDCPSLLQRVYKGRKVQKSDDVDYTLDSLLSYKKIKHIDRAIDRLSKAMQKQETVVIIGDFDADGATSTAVMVRSLTSFGAKHVQYLVPNRFHYGYGLTPEIVELAAKRNPDLIVTVDNGVSSYLGVVRANELGMDVIVTDHHLPPDDLPPACAVVNPNQEGDKFPSKNLAGVGVIFYVMLALRAYLKQIGWFKSQSIEHPKMINLLDYVALGTIADLVSLDKNNRILVHQGIQRIRSGLACPGILALIHTSRCQAGNLQASDIAYGLAPRLNAAGRLDDMSLGVECLLAMDIKTGIQAANKLNALNERRRSIEIKMEQEAYSILDALNFDDMKYFGICVYHPSWHQGVVGLIASRLKKKLNRPIIAFSKVSNTELKGSARSVKGLHIRDILSEIATNNPKLISNFGGHSMAAGLSIDINNFSKFQDAFSEIINRKITFTDFEYILETDGELSSNELTLGNAEILRDAGPWGQDFPEPLFDGKFRIICQRIVKERHLKMVLQPKDSTIHVDAIAFNVDLETWPNNKVDIVQLLYRLDVNYFKGKKRLQLLIEDLFSEHREIA